MLQDLVGRHVVVLNWRDLEHPQSGGAEVFAERMAEQLVSAGARVTMVAGRASGQAAAATRNGFSIRRMGGTFGVYPAALWWLLRHRRSVDAVVDCQNGIPFFSPLAVRRDTPVVQVIHHVHQRQFGLFFGRFAAAVGRQLEARGSRLVYGRRPSASVSPSTRDEVRSLLRLPGARFLVPNGTDPAAIDGVARAERPTLVCVGRLVPHKRTDLLVRAVAELAGKVAGLQVHMVGTGPDEAHLHALCTELGLGPDVMRWHGRIPAAERDALLAGAWLTVNTTGGEGWGISVMEAAALGVPALAFDVPGLRDSIVPAVTGWLVDEGADLAAAIAGALDDLAQPHVNERFGEACRAWAQRFSWQRSGDLLRTMILAESQRLAKGGRERRRRDDVDVAVELSGLRARIGAGGFRSTDLVYADEGACHALLYGCDEQGAEQALARVKRGVVAGADRPGVRSAERSDYLKAATAPVAG